jgi:hypothetical protein
MKFCPGIHRSARQGGNRRWNRSIPVYVQCLARDCRPHESRALRILPNLLGQCAQLCPWSRRHGSSPYDLWWNIWSGRWRRGSCSQVGLNRFGDDADHPSSGYDECDAVALPLGLVGSRAIGVENSNSKPNLFEDSDDLFPRSAQVLCLTNYRDPPLLWARLVWRALVLLRSHGRPLRWVWVGAGLGRAPILTSSPGVCQRHAVRDVDGANAVSAPVSTACETDNGAAAPTTGQDSASVDEHRRLDLRPTRISLS